MSVLQGPPDAVCPDCGHQLDDHDEFGCDGAYGLPDICPSWLACTCPNIWRWQ